MGPDASLVLLNHLTIAVTFSLSVKSTRGVQPAINPIVDTPTGRIPVALNFGQIGEIALAWDVIPGRHGNRSEGRKTAAGEALLNHPKHLTDVFAVLPHRDPGVFLDPRICHQVLPHRDAGVFLDLLTCHQKLAGRPARRES